jgi:hypothetical protein
MLPYYGGELEKPVKRGGSMIADRGYGGREVARPDAFSSGMGNMFDNMMESHNRAMKEFDSMTNKMMSGFGFKGRHKLYNIRVKELNISPDLFHEEN